MPALETRAVAGKVVFACAGHSYTVRDVIDAAHFRGELQPLWRNLLRLLEVERQADERDLEINDAVVDRAAEQFRYEHNLITAEETERWLADRSLTLSDFSDYFVRHHWPDETGAEPEPLDYLSAPNELRELLAVELIFSGELDEMARRLAWRIAVSQGADAQPAAEEEAGFLERSELKADQLNDWLGKLERDEEWFREMLAMETIYRRTCQALLTPQARAREIAALRLPLTRFEIETIDLDSLDAAREAFLCVEDDGMTMEEVAAEGRFTWRHSEIFLEDIPEELQQRFLSARPGRILEPIARGEEFQLCRVIAKIEPNDDDPTVKERTQKRIFQRHFEGLTAKHIQWRLVPA